MIAREHTIGHSVRIGQILKKGRRSSGRFLQFRILPNRGSGLRFAIVQGKKLAKTAVARNTLRRRVHEAIRRNFPTGEKPCYDVVVLLSRQITDAAFSDIEKDVQHLLKKI